MESLGCQCDLQSMREKELITSLYPSLRKTAAVAGSVYLDAVLRHGRDSDGSWSGGSMSP
jgi:hypothetical protein